MEEHLEVRLRLPEEETLPHEFPENRHGDDARVPGAADEDMPETERPSHELTEKKHDGDSPGSGNVELDADTCAPRADGDAPEPSLAEDHVSHVHDSAWQADKTTESWDWSEPWASWDCEHHGGHWHHYDSWNSHGYDSYWTGYGKGFENGYGDCYGNNYWGDYGGYGYGGYGYGYYGSGCYEEQKPPETPVQRSRSVESGLSDFTSISAIHAKLNRLDTPDVVGKNDNHLPAGGVAQPSSLPEIVLPGQKSDDSAPLLDEGKSNSDAAHDGNDRNQNHGPAEEHPPAEEPGQHAGDQQEDGDNEDNRLFMVLCDENQLYHHSSFEVYI